MNDKKSTEYCNRVNKRYPSHDKKVYATTELSFSKCKEQVRRTQQGKKVKAVLPHLESITRLSNIPIVESGWNYAGNVYMRIKNSNSLIYWTLGRAESSLNTALEVTLPPTVAIFERPINAIDKFLCKSLDVVEQQVPNIHLPPHMMYWETKQYVNSKLVRPVLERADSVKQIGNSVLHSKYTAFAADKLEDALNVADKYVDKYLPDSSDSGIEPSIISKPSEDPAEKAVQTMHHVDRFSRKLQCRLTKRTLAEAKALKERSQESIHVLLYVAELVATDPKQALVKARQLWSTLSEAEPENQARPATLEQLIVMLTRESARRVVHFVNFTREVVVKLPETVSQGVQVTTRHCKQLVNGLVKNIHLEELTNAVTDNTKNRARSLSTVLRELNVYTNNVLERLAFALAGQSESKKPIKPSQSPKQYRNNHHSTQSSTNVHQQVPVRSQYRVAHRYTNSIINNGAQS